MDKWEIPVGEQQKAMAFGAAVVGIGESIQKLLDDMRYRR